MKRPITYDPRAAAARETARLRRPSPWNAPAIEPEPETAGDALFPLLVVIAVALAAVAGYMLAAFIG